MHRLQSALEPQRDSVYGRLSLSREIALHERRNFIAKSQLFKGESILSGLSPVKITEPGLEGNLLVLRGTLETIDVLRRGLSHESKLSDQEKDLSST